ncbi:hypothetical protein DFH07DRAFT_1025030 [Mycena maculata]|uniref:Uncharacterized protein n=1 Tax=Mycena maculata TaxID=230809 RepID=A0AAD7NFW8_9AGAR|nr:hypothetical protein DFH07DRAFT_1025030 [Mycena maculata]
MNKRLLVRATLIQTRFELLTVIKAEALEQMAATRRHAMSKRTNGCIAHMADIEVDNLAVIEMGETRRNWRLCTRKEEDEVSDEIIARIQGVLTKNNLVPRNVHSCSQHKAQFLSQSVEISGLRTATFGEAISKISTVHDRFGEHLGGTTMLDIPSFDTGVGPVFSASNRLFTLKSDCPTEQDVEFHEGIDTLGLLNRLKSGELIHAPENMVKFFKRVKHVDDGYEYAPFVPGGFKIGDIVELQVTFVALASRMNKVKLTSRLQAVTLLDNTFAKRAALARKDANKYSRSKPAIRRKIGYFQDDIEDDRTNKKHKSTSLMENEDEMNQ